MTVFEAIIQGIIQGATEFLPVSSSGHLSISKHLFGIELPGILFDIMLHLGTLVAVVFVYRKLIWRLLKEFGSLCVDVVHGKFKWSEMNHDRRLIFMLIIGLLPLFLLFAPIPGTGMQLKDLSDQLGSDSSMLAEGLALLATSALLFLGIRADRLTHKKTIQDRQGKRVQNPGRKKLHTVDAIVIGLTQCVAAVFPGSPGPAPPSRWGCCGASTSRLPWITPLCWASPPSPRRLWCPSRTWAPTAPPSAPRPSSPGSSPRPSWAFWPSSS